MRTFKVLLLLRLTLTIEADGGDCIQQREVKFDDLLRTTGSESDCLVRVLWSRTLAGGSKMIRYRCSSGRKLCRLALYLYGG